MIKRTSLLGTILFIFVMFFTGFASAQWQSGLENGLVNYWNGSVANGVYSGNDLVINTGTPTYQSSNCIVGDCIDFDSGDTLNVSSTASDGNFNPNITRGWTINYWIRTESATEQYAMIKGFFAGEHWNMHVRTHADNKVKFYSNAASTPHATLGPSIFTNNYVMVTVTQNTTAICMWINATLDGGCAAAAAWGINANPLMLGNDQGFPYIGQLDEIGIWNRTLNNTEIDELFNGGGGTTYSAAGAPAPPENVTNPNPITTYLGLIPEVYYPFDNLAFAQNATNFGFYNFTLDHNLSACGLVDCYSEYVEGKLFDAAYNNDSDARFFSINKYEDYLDFHNDSWTWAFWFNTSESVANQNILDKAGVSGATTDRWYVDYNPNSNLRFNLHNSTQVLTQVTAKANISDSQWHRVVFTYDNSSQNLTVYVDNVFNTTYKVGLLDLNNSYIFQVGKITTGYWKGMIDDLQFYRVAWNSTIVALDYNSGYGVNHLLAGNISEINQTYVTQTQELTSNKFSITSYYDPNFNTIEGTLIYNNTEYASTSSYFTGNDIVTFNTSATSPDVSVLTNTPFYWSLNGTYTNGTSLLFNSTSYNQLVFPFALDNCSSNSLLFMNISLYDEDSRTFLNGTASNSSMHIELSFSGTTSFNSSFTQINPAQICINTLNSTISMDAAIRYTTTDRVVEYYHIQNQNVSNTTIPLNVNLYDLTTVQAQEFLITYKDRNFVPVSDAIIEIQRKYIPDSIYQVVEIPKTDNSGQTIGHFVLSDEIYNLVVKKNGVTLSTYNDVVAVCQDTSTGQCTINLNAFQSGTDPSDYNNYNNVTFSLVFDTNNNEFDFSFTNNDGNNHLMEVNVSTLTGTQTQVCYNSVTATSGLISCSVSGYSNTTFVATAYKDGSFVGQVFHTVTDDSSVKGFDRNTGIILAMILYITIPLMMVTDRVLMIIAGILGLIFAGILGFYTSGSIIGASSVILWFVVAGGILIYKITRRRI